MLDNYYLVEFQDQGPARELRSPHDKAAINRARSMMVRWNRNGFKIFRVNPFNGDRREIGSFDNPNFDPEKELLTEDIIADYIPVAEREKGRKKSKRTSNGRQGNNADLPPAPDFEVTIKDLAEKANTTPTAIRRKLRNSGIEKKYSRWGWNDWNDPEVQTILKWF